VNFSLGLKKNKWLFDIFIFTLLLLISSPVTGQTLRIKGFADVNTSVENQKVSFDLGEQDLFLTAELSNKLSFLGETVFGYDPDSKTKFSVSIERLLLKYNLYQNNNLIVGKVHTPINYWNDNYHHGKLFYPTIDRPSVFEAEIIPLHSTGIGFQGQNLGKLKFGYDFMIANGIGSYEIGDNDSHKSWTLAAHIKPFNNWRIGASYYNDIISKGAKLHDGKDINHQVSQQLYTASVSYFGKKYELLAEFTLGDNHTDTTGNKKTQASYLYAGYKIKDKWVVYGRFDDLRYQAGEILFDKNNTWSYLIGIRYKINYLSVVKLEYKHQEFELSGSANKISMQFAIGF
jgi:hypothetical protein